MISVPGDSVEAAGVPGVSRVCLRVRLPCLLVAFVKPRSYSWEEIDFRSICVNVLLDYFSVRD